MRGIITPISEIRREIFTEVARVGFESENIMSDIEDIPYRITPGEQPRVRDSIWRERAVASERVRLAMGLSLRPEDRPVHITSGVEESNIDEKYYEPPLMQVIPSACDACDAGTHFITDICHSCVAHPCMEVCPRDAIKRVKGKTIIDESKCMNCGKCKAICPYHAINRKRKPCAEACGVDAIETDSSGRAYINADRCVSCGQCMVSCPFGAIADKSQIFQLARAIRNGTKIIAEVAPAFEGQFGNDVTPKQVKSALLDLGFSDVVEVALGADIGALAEAKHYVEKVTTGELPFLLTSCCPSWSMLAKVHFPETINSISQELTPMVATARSIKKKHPDVKVVFIGPCPAKKLEAMRRSVRSDVDFVITFEEMAAMLDARGIDVTTFDSGRAMHDATGAGRGYAVAGGVAKAIENVINEYYPGTEVNIEHAEGLSECKKMLLLAKAGKKDGCLIEGMGCPGGCIAGAGTIAPIQKAKMNVANAVKNSSDKIPPKDLLEIDLS